MNNNETGEATAQLGKVKCNDCGAFLVYNIGTTTLKCEYCASEIEIPIENTTIEDLDLDTFLSNDYITEETYQVRTVKCTECGASTTLNPEIISDNCPYCTTPLIVANAVLENHIKPKSLVPFLIDKKSAIEIFNDWIRSLQFAPNDLKENGTNATEKLIGIYLPYWTFDCNTYSEYRGKRGEHYDAEETYRDSEGNAQTRKIQKTDWTEVSGSVLKKIDNTLICASNTLPKDTIQKLEPWDLNQLVEYNDAFLSGLKSEQYSIDLENGWKIAKQTIDSKIDSEIRSQIGGDEQIISYLKANYNDKTFKHILLPLWISAYKYKNKVYQFTINAQTGEIQGERPYSFWKRFRVFLIIITIILLLMFYPKIQHFFR